MKEDSFQLVQETERGEKRSAEAREAEPEPAPEDREKEKDRLTMLHREAQIIAQNLKESGTRR